MKLLQHVKTIVAFSNKRKRLDEVDNHHAMLESMQLAARIAYEHEKGQRVWGGDKTKEMPRVRKDFEVYQMVYCMEVVTFMTLLTTELSMKTTVQWMT